MSVWARARDVGARLNWVRRNALGINRRNQELVLRHNPGRLIGLVNHKVRTKEALAKVGVTVPDTYAVCSNPAGLGALEAQLAKQPEFVLKPARGAGGEGVVVVTGHDGDQLVKASGARLPMADLLAHAADILNGAFSLSQTHDEVLVEQRLEIDPALAPFSPGGVADLRLLVAWGVPLMAMLRLPTRASDGRANLHMGGIGVGLELATGRPCYAVGSTGVVERHPDTEQALCDVRVPHWREALVLAARCYEAVPLGYLGADIVMDARLGPAILELNARPGLSIQMANRQALRPLLDLLMSRESVATLAEYNVERRVDLGLDIRRAAAAH